MRLVALLFRVSYQLRHHEWAGVSLERWAMFGLLIAAGLFAVGVLPGGLAGVVSCGIFLVAVIVIASLAARRQFVVFKEEPASELPHAAGSALDPADKLLLRATGLFEVEGKEARFADLLAYFRSFQTREHAVMAIVPPSKMLLVGSWPDSEVGMWYLFFKANEIRRIRPGLLSFGWHSRPALLIDVEQVIPPPTSPLDVWGGYRSGNQKPKVRRQVFYLSFDSPSDRQTVLGDLLADATPLRPSWPPPT
jgi:hypothetical protein